MTRRIDDDAVKRRIWNIVEKWKYQGRKYDALLLESVIAQIVDTQPTLTPPNEPLTFEERREMDGKPVWLDDEKTWGILQVWDDNNVDAVFLRPRGCIRVKSVIGKKIYRRPPEGEEDT